MPSSKKERDSHQGQAVAISVVGLNDAIVLSSNNNDTGCALNSQEQAKCASIVLGNIAHESVLVPGSCSCGDKVH